MSYQLDLSRYQISHERLVALLAEFNGAFVYGAGSSQDSIEFTPMEGFEPYDLAQRFLAALQSYKK